MNSFRLSEVYDRIEIESLAEGQVQYRNDSNERYGKLRSARESSEEYVEKSKMKMARNVSKERLTHLKKCKHTSAQRLVDNNERLGMKMHMNNIDVFPNDNFPVHNVKHEVTGTNPFRSNRLSESTVSQLPDYKWSDSFQNFKIKIEVPSPVSTESVHDGNTLKRKYNTDSDSESDDQERDSKKRKINEDDATLGSKKIWYNYVKSKQRLNFWFYFLGLDEDTLGLEHVTFFCAHCSDANNVNESNCGTIEDVYGHWLSGHTDLKNVKPFWFYVTKTLRCFYCDVLCNYHEMLKHHQNHHPCETFAIVNQTDRTKCGVCEYIGTEIDAHFVAEHDGLIQSTVFYPARLSVAMLGKLFEIDIHKKRQCDRCNIILETQHEMEIHQLTEHNGETTSSEYFDGQSAYVFIHCQSVKMVL